MAKSVICSQTKAQRVLRSLKRINIVTVALLLWGMIIIGCISPRANGNYIEQATNSGNRGTPVNTHLSSDSSSSLKPGRVLGVVVDEKMMVLEVESKSASEVAGIQKGDVLQSIDNASFLEARDNIKDRIGSYSDEDKPMQLTLRRDGKDMMVEVKPLSPPMQIELIDGTPVPLITPVLSSEDYY